MRVLNLNTMQASPTNQIKKIKSIKPIIFYVVILFIKFFLNIGIHRKNFFLVTITNRMRRVLLKAFPLKMFSQKLTASTNTKSQMISLIYSLFEEYI